MKLYQSYVFRDKDPVIYEVRDAIKEAGVTHAFIEQKSGVTVNTLHNWFDGPTLRPQHATVRAVLRSIGYDYRLVKMDEKVVHLSNRSRSYAKLPKLRGRG